MLVIEEQDVLSGGEVQVVAVVGRVFWIYLLEVAQFDDKCVLRNWRKTYVLFVFIVVEKDFPTYDFWI